MSSFVIFKKSAAQDKSLKAFIDNKAVWSCCLDIPSDEGLQVFLWAALRPETCCLYKAADGGFIAVAGTFLYGNQEGEAAAKLFYEAYSPDTVSVQGTSGHFAAVIAKAGMLHVLNDRLGAWKLYANTEESFVSAGFLEALLLTPSPAFDTQGLYEYVFNGHPLGVRSFLKGLHAALPGEGFALGASEKITSIPHSPSLGASKTRHGDQPLSAVAGDQLSVVQAMANKYSILAGRVTASLSGGFDSRLMLSSFLKAGLTPDLFVYGRDSDPDVRSAKAVAQVAGMPIRHIDKSLIDTLESDRPSAETLLFYFDGWQEDGLFHSEIDFLDRMSRSKIAPFMANGSGGEIYRHFFLYPNWSVKVNAFLQATYARVDMGIVSKRFDKKTYLARVRKSFVALMGLQKNRMQRQDVDRVYTNVRCTHEKARDIVLNHRFAKVLYPFMEPDLMERSIPLPYEYRQFGRVEAKMITLSNPQLAAVPAEYGHHFAEEPGLKYKIRLLESYYRPLWVRRLIPLLRRKLGRSAGIHALMGDRMRFIEDKSFPNMAVYFRLEKVAAPLAASRIAALELLAQTFKIQSH